MKKLPFAVCLVLLLSLPVLSLSGDSPAQTGPWYSPDWPGLSLAEQREALDLISAQDQQLTEAASLIAEYRTHTAGLQIQIRDLLILTDEQQSYRIESEQRTTRLRIFCGVLAGSTTILLATTILFGMMAK